MQYKHEPLDFCFKFSFTKFNTKQKESGKKMSIVKMSKKGDFEGPKVQNHDFSTKSVSQ